MKDTGLLVKILTGIFGRWVKVIVRTEYEQREEAYRKKLTEYEKHIASLQIDQVEYQFLRHFAATLIQLEKLLHNKQTEETK